MLIKVQGEGEEGRERERERARERERETERERERERVTIHSFGTENLASTTYIQWPGRVIFSLLLEAHADFSY
jgi:hypothetical protein